MQSKQKTINSDSDEEEEDPEDEVKKMSPMKKYMHLNRMLSD